MDKYIRKEKDKKVEQTVREWSCKTIGLILIVTLLLIMSPIGVVNAQTPNPYFQLFIDDTLKIWNDMPQNQ